MKRGRKSTGDLTVVVGMGTKMPPAPPAELSDAQAQVWRDCVGSLPGDWVPRGSFHVLISHCRHVCRSRLLERQLRSFETEWMAVDGGLERFNLLLQMAQRETQLVLATARALRLNPQQRIDPRMAGRRINDWPADAARPWDPD